MVTSGAPSTTHRPTPTRSQVLRARQQAVGGRRKRCQRGKNCSATCISGDEICLVEFPLPVSQGITKTRNALANYVLKANKVLPGSHQERRLVEAVDQISKVMNIRPSGEGESIKKPSVEWKQDKKRSERRALSWREIEDLRKRGRTLGDAEGDPETLKMLRKEATSRGVTLPRRELEMIYDALPDSLRKSMNSAGRAHEKWWAGSDENGNDIFRSGTTGNRERGLAVLDLWLKQGGTSAYESAGGRVWSLKDMNIEHFVPKSKGGTDSPSNWLLVRAGANQARGSKGIAEWINGLPKSEKEYKSFLSNYRSEKTKGRLKKAIQKAMNPKDYTDREIVGWGASKMGKAFGARTLFTGMFQPIQNISKGPSGATSGPPLPFAKGIALIAKTRGLDEAQQVTYKLRDIWNTQLMKNKSITPSEAFKQMSREVENKLTPEQVNLFRPAANSWAQSRDVKSYGFSQ